MNEAQCKMARAGLGWSLDELAQAAGVSRMTVVRFERGDTVQPESVEALRAAFVKEGIAFTNGGKRFGLSILRREIN